MTDNGQWLTSPFLNNGAEGILPPMEQLPGTPVPVDILVEEARTGRFMFGAGINSDAGVTGQITVDERNFDLFGFPRRFSDIWSGEAWRGAGQGFRLEAMPGNRVQRYLVSFTEPYLFSTPLSLTVSGYLYDRGYYDWDENRVGGRLGLGYRLTPDLSVSASLRMEDVDISDPRVRGVPALDNVLGSNDLYSARYTLRHDTRDLPFLPTEGHLIELSYEQAFGEFDYPRGEVDYRRYFLIRERPDGSGRHVLAASIGAGVSGTDTPLFENYFAGGFSTLRGFHFRGASPVEDTVTVGGRFRLLGSFEYMLPLTADDMIRAVAFVDYGTVEEDVRIDSAQLPCGTRDSDSGFLSPRWVPLRWLSISPSRSPRRTRTTRKCSVSSSGSAAARCQSRMSAARRTGSRHTCRISQVTVGLRPRSSRCRIRARRAPTAHVRNELAIG